MFHVLRKPHPKKILPQGSIGNSQIPTLEMATPVGNFPTGCSVGISRENILP